MTANRHYFHFVHKPIKQKGPVGQDLLLWPTRKDSEPLPRFARGGSTPIQTDPVFRQVLPLTLSASRAVQSKKAPSGGAFCFGLPERILNLSLALRGPEAPPYKPIPFFAGCFHSRSRPHGQSKAKRPRRAGPLGFGLPERIRTFDLQSRSLTRYPAVPRVDDHLVCRYYTINRR